MRNKRVVVIGAGIGGLACAIDLARAGRDVVVVDTAAAPGGKLRQIAVGNRLVDAGPTVFTMRWVFDGLFEAAAARLDDHLTLRPSPRLARHAWSDHETLDLYSDIDRSADAVGAFAGSAEARGYLRFCAESERIYLALRDRFLFAQQAGFAGFLGRMGRHRPASLLGLRPFDTLWAALGDHFRDPRLRQLYGRYATYCGSSPFAAPATLMLIAHVEREGVWTVEGGMQRLAVALESLAVSLGVTFAFGTAASRIEVANGRVAAVRLASGERLEADGVVVNADPAVLRAGALGPDVVSALADQPAAGPSLSAVTWAMVARTGGFSLARHNVFFSRDYAAEFRDILARGRLPADPTVYVCAQDRSDGDAAPTGPERLFVIVNAPATGDGCGSTRAELSQCETRVFDHLASHGLTVERDASASLMVAPRQFAERFPGTGGALYGSPTHGWNAAFRRPGAKTRIPGLYLAGGSVHPGPGLPMAALSGRLAALRLIADQDSTRRSRPAAMSGGTSTP